MTEQKPKDKMGELVKFVDDNFKSNSVWDILSVFPQYFILVLFLAIAFIGAFLTLGPNLSSAWIPVFISIGAFFAAFYSFLMASRKFVNRNLANKEAKRLELLLADKSNEAVCLLKPLVLLKMEHYWKIKLQVLYELNKDLFTVSKLTEYYYLS
jgi:hypothetical protein